MRHQPPVRFALVPLFIAALISLHAPAAAPAFVQQNFATPQTTSAGSVSVTCTAAQTAGDLNVVVVGWNDTQAAVSSVSDTAGNVYALAVGPTPGTGLSQSVYYAKKIVSGAAGANRLKFNIAPATGLPEVSLLALG